ncbi:MB21D1 [Mytilus coruscus]|uniref:MB21D1 n=1 Tax=Mytilus coruscus TaxID=42192 RepID=A0A6J8DI40_MYTCO|nr:MB21D1 [Mytilus coruscus]
MQHIKSSFNYIYLLKIVAIMSKCQECETEVKTERKLAIHNCSAVEPEIDKCKCSECGKTFKTGKGLKTHITKVHGKPSCERTSNAKTTESTIDQEIKYDTQLPCQTLDKNQDHDDCNSIISKEIVPVMQDEAATSSLNSSYNQEETEKAVFNCNQCKGSFKTIRGLKQHVSKSHKVSTKNAHDSQVLPIHADKSGNAGLGKKSSTKEDEFQNVDIVEASSKEGEETVSDNSVQNAVFNCNQCEKSFKTIRGLKQHVSKSHKVSTKNAHDSPVLSIDADKSDNTGLGKKEKLSTDEDEFQNVDIMEASSNDAEESVLDNSVQNAVFKCNQCEKSFKTIRGLKQHVSKSHTVSTKNAHYSPVLPIDSDKSGNAGLGKKEKSSTDEDEFQYVDIVAASANEGEESVLVESKSPYSTEEVQSVDDYEDAVLPEVESGEEANSELLKETEKAVFNCNQCKGSFKTIRGLKQHVSKSHKVSTKNAHDSQVLPIHADKSGNAGLGKKSSTKEDEFQNVDIVEATSKEGEETVSDNSVQNAVFNCNQCEKSFKTIRGLKQHVSKSHKVSTKNAHDSPVLSIDVDKSDNTGLGKKEKLSTDEDEFQNVDIVEASSNDAEESVLDNSVQNAVFKCNQCEKSFKTIRGLKQHVSKSHTVSTKNAHYSPVLPIDSDKSGNAGLGKKEKSSTDEDEFQYVDIVTASANEGEESVLVESKSPYSTEEVQSVDDYEDVVLPEVESGEEANSELLKRTFVISADTSALLQESKSPFSTEEEESDDDYEDAELPEVLESDEETNSESLKECVQRDTRPVTTKTKRIVDKLKKENSLTKSETSVAVTETKKLVDTFFEQLRELSPTLKWQRFNSGSYYDKTKNDQADEFDIMIYPDKIQVEVNFDSPIMGFYKVKFESPRVEENFRNLETNGYIHPGKFKEYVFGLFDKVFQSTDHHIFRRVTKKERSDNSSPAYTIIYNGIPGNPIDIDLVPCFRINTWPCIARKIDPTWIHSKLVNVVNDAIKCYDVVSKTCPDDVEDRDLLWRLSFSYTEKKLVNSANSVDKFSTKKTVFRLIKSLIQELKDNNPEIMKKFCSYHIKQFMFKQYDTWGEIYDEAKILRNVLQKLLDQLSGSPPFIENYFIENDNVIRYVPQPEIALVVKFLREKMKEL